MIFRIILIQTGAILLDRGVDAVAVVILRKKSEQSGVQLGVDRGHLLRPIRHERRVRHAWIVHVQDELLCALLVSTRGNRRGKHRLPPSREALRCRPCRERDLVRLLAARLDLAFQVLNVFL